MARSEDKDEGRFLAGQLLNSLTATNDLIQNLSKEIQAHAVNLATIKAGLGNLDETVHSLSKILKEGGDGQGSVLSRIAVLDKVVETLDSSVAHMQSDITHISDNIIKVKSRIYSLEQEFGNKAAHEKVKENEIAEQKKSSLQVRMTLFASVAAFITSIVTALIAFLLNS